MRTYLYILALGLALTACSVEKADHITVLSTTDTHSQVEPLPKNASRLPDMGGFARRMGIIKQERQLDPNLLLFDSGDFSQGTPYFNFYRGRIEVDALNRMGYDACTLGNHEFDNGLDTLAMLLRLANFPVLVANYEVTGTPLEGLIQPYTIIKKGGIKVGVLGVSVAGDDLIAAKNFEGIRYLEPIPVINETAALLRKKGCDVVICLSHLGSDVPGVAGHEEDFDLNIIPHIHGVDLFLSGHSHHIHQDRLKDADDQEVLLVQSGKSGTYIGKTILHLQPAE